MPIKQAVGQLQCELREFIRTRPPGTKLGSKLIKLELDERKLASVSLYLQTDTKGNVAYVGVDLNKIGLPGLADLITANNSGPSLQFSVDATATIKSQIDLTIPQKVSQVDEADNMISGRCATRESKSQLYGGKSLVGPLGLEAFLTEFFETNENNPVENTSACLKKLTLQTQFVIVFDTKAGMNPLVGGSFILPISGLNVQYQPKFAHQLQIVLSFKTPDGCPKDKDDITLDEEEQKKLAKRNSAKAPSPKAAPAAAAGGAPIPLIGGSTGLSQ